MLQEALGSGPFLWILGEGRLDERMECRRPLVLLFERGRLVATLRHEEERTHRMQIEHGWLQLGQLYGRDAARPDITELIVATLALHRSHFRCHPIRCSDEAPSLVDRGRDLGGHSKIGQLNVARFSEEDVGSLDVPMHLVH